MNHKEYREHKGFKARSPYLRSLRSLRSLRLKNLFKIKNQQNNRRLISRLDRHERAVPEGRDALGRRYSEPSLVGFDRLARPLHLLPPEAILLKIGPPINCVNPAPITR